MTAFVCCFKLSMGVSSGENEHGSAKGRWQDYCACNPLFILSHFDDNTGTPENKRLGDPCPVRARDPWDRGGLASV